MLHQPSLPSELRAHLEGMDYQDMESATSSKDLCSVLVDMFRYTPGWLKALYRIRSVVARLLGLEHDERLATGAVRDEDISTSPGGKARFFTVVAFRKDAWWIGEVRDSHLTALGVLLREPEGTGPATYHMITAVRYNNRLGPLYFALVKPFHRLIVRAMLRHAAAAPEEIP